MSHNARPRLLMITPAYPPQVGGIQLLAARLAEQLAMFDVSVVAPAAERAVDAGVVVLRAPSATLHLRGPARIAALNAYAAAMARADPAGHRAQHAHRDGSGGLGDPCALRAVRLRVRAGAEGGARRRALSRAERAVAISSYSLEVRWRMAPSRRGWS